MYVYIRLYSNVCTFTFVVGCEMNLIEIINYNEGEKRAVCESVSNSELYCNDAFHICIVYLIVSMLKRFITNKQSV